jgi:predicted MFS family arabinose efflux permease
MIPVALADGALLVTPAYAGGLATLCLSLGAFGTAHGMLNIAMNAHAVEVERAWRRSIMSSFHAVYSMGGFAGAAVGGLFAAADRSAAATFLAVAAGALVVGGLAARARRARGCTRRLRG